MSHRTASAGHVTSRLLALDRAAAVAIEVARGALATRRAGTFGALERTLGVQRTVEGASVDRVTRAKEMTRVGGTGAIVGQTGVRGHWRDPPLPPLPPAAEPPPAPSPATDEPPEPPELLAPPLPASLPALPFPPALVAPEPDVLESPPLPLVPVTAPVPVLAPAPSDLAVEPPHPEACSVRKRRRLPPCAMYWRFAMCSLRQRYKASTRFAPSEFVPSGFFPDSVFGAGRLTEGSRRGACASKVVVGRVSSRIAGLAAVEVVAVAFRFER